VEISALALGRVPYPNLNTLVKQEQLLRLWDTHRRRSRAICGTKSSRTLLVGRGRFQPAFRTQGT